MQEKERDEAWILNEFIKLDDLKRDNAPVCDTEECDLKALYIYEGQQSNSLWKSCIDCQLNDYKDWPGMEECNDATDNLPFTKEMDEIVRKKCTSNSSLIILSHISRVESKETSANEDNVEDNESTKVNETQMENDISRHGNDFNSNDSIDSNSVCTHVIPDEELQPYVELY